MNHVERAYKAWRATVKAPATVTGVWRRLDASRTGRHRRAISAKQRENYRRGAKKMWKRRKAEAR